MVERQAYDAVIVGAGAAGLMCAQTAASRGGSVVLVEHTDKVGEKIRISGGGRCNFTNLFSTPDNFLSHNPHFCKSALKRYTPYDFLDLVERHNILWTEKAAGQLFAQDSAMQIIRMLKQECQSKAVEFALSTRVDTVEKTEDGFRLVIMSPHGPQSITTKTLVIATGGKSIPKIGATGWGYGVADQFDLNLIPTRAGLVPFTFEGENLAALKALSGIAVPLTQCQSQNGQVFADALLFTHRGLSGPAILQISSYWQEGETLDINLTPEQNVADLLLNAKSVTPKQSPSTVLRKLLPTRLSDSICQEMNADIRLADASHARLHDMGRRVNAWCVTPSGTEGYRTAEVTLGGVDTNHISSKTMEAKAVSGLYFIGEVLDVTGHLGGHNFQWAWASATAAGQAIAQKRS